MATSAPGQATVLETLEKLTAATDKSKDSISAMYVTYPRPGWRLLEYVEEQSAENEAGFKAALEEHRKSLSVAKDRIKATTVALTQKEFDVATPDGKLVIAKKLQEDMGNIGIKGALSCAIVGVQGTATKLQKAWADGELFDGKNKVKEEAVPKRRVESAPIGSEEAGETTRYGAENREATHEKVEPVSEQAAAEASGEKAHVEPPAEASGEKAHVEPPAEASGEKAHDEHAAEPSGEKANGEPAAGGKGGARQKVGEVIEGVTEQFGRLVGKIAARASGEKTEAKAGDKAGDKTDGKAADNKVD